MGEQSERDRLWGAAALAAIRAFNAVVEINTVGVVTTWNDGAARLFGLVEDERGSSLGALVADAHRDAFDSAVLAAHDAATSDQPGWQGILTLVRSDGEPFDAEVLLVPAPPEMAGSTLLVITMANEPATILTMPTEAAGRLVDGETFAGLLDDAVARADDGAPSAAVLRIAFDGRGDAPVDADDAEIAEGLCRLAGEIGAVTVLEGRGFALLLDPMHAPFVAANVADRVLDAGREPLDGIDGASGSTVSIGIGFVCDDIVRGADVLAHADDALARARALGGDRCEIFDDKVREELDERRRFRDELYVAIDAGEFRVHYQAATDLVAERTTMVEALVRWDHHERGLVAAGEFVQLAEETGLILPLGAWVLNEACCQLRAWLDQLGEAAPVVVVNFSPEQLHHPAALQLVAGVIEANALDPGRLCLEISESALLADPARTGDRLRELRALGIRLSVDHVGVDPSSLDILRELPVDVLKVDRSVIAEIDTSEATRALATSIVHAAHDVGMAVGAEGIETAGQCDAATAIGFEHVQGFLIARPQGPDEITQLITLDLAGEPHA